jgi:hypothetical protein
MDERNAAVAVADVLKKRIESVVEDMADRRCDDYLVAAWARELESVLGPDVVG